METLNSLYSLTSSLNSHSFNQTPYEMIAKYVSSLWLCNNSCSLHGFIHIEFSHSTFLCDVDIVVQDHVKPQRRFSSQLEQQIVDALFSAFPPSQDFYYVFPIRNYSHDVTQFITS